MTHPSIDGLPDLWKETYDLVSQVPEGMVTTYGEVARALGDPVAARFVGLAMSRNMDVVQVPCRRVIRSDGGLGGYSSPEGVDEKARLLRGEGLCVRNGRVADLARHLFIDFRSSEPLKLLRKRQKALRRQVRIPSVDIEFEKVAGADISYGSEQAFAAVAVFDARTGEVTERHQTVSEAGFPYIPTYLAFRELPIIASLVGLLDDEAILMYDGNGILHPEKFGIASHAGIAFSLPTIGVAKRLLCGRVDSRTDKDGVAAVVDEEALGYAFSLRGSAPIYVSPGHAISMKQALSTVRALTKHRIPEPIRIAHVLANDARRSAINK